MELNGKVALVTGGAHRLGKALSVTLAEAGADVAINFHSSATSAGETAAQIAALGRRVIPVQADVSQCDQVKRMMGEIRRELGEVDILVNSASPFERTPFPTGDVSAWERVIAVGIHGAFYCANEVVPDMRRSGGGVIVNIVDLSAWQPWRQFGAHSVAKAGLLAMTRQWALELAPEIRVNAIAPGKILPPPGASPAQTARLGQENLLGRWGSADDVTRALLYLLQADFVTGEVLLVDGGESLGRIGSATRS